MPPVDDAPVYEFPVRFFEKYLGIHPETGLRYLRLEVLRPDAVIGSDQRPLFKVDPQVIQRHKAAIAAYKNRRRAATHNVKDLRYVA
jgi:hypothetical protein